MWCKAAAFKLQIIELFVCLLAILAEFCPYFTVETIHISSTFYRYRCNMDTETGSNRIPSGSIGVDCYKFYGVSNRIDSFSPKGS